MKFSLGIHSGTNNVVAVCPSRRFPHSDEHLASFHISDTDCLMFCVRIETYTYVYRFYAIIDEDNPVR